MTRGWVINFMVVRGAFKLIRQNAEKHILCFHAYRKHSNHCALCRYRSTKIHASYENRQHANNFKGGYCNNREDFRALAQLHQPLCVESGSLLNVVRSL